MLKNVAAAALAAITMTACTTDPYTGDSRMSNTAGGALLGAGVGALAGLAVGGSGASQRSAALIGAGVGALAGGAIGSYMDRQESELREQLRGTGVGVTRRGDYIVLNMPSNITFATDQAAISSGFYPTLNAVALVLNRFRQTIVDVSGHTDSTGSAQYNLDLSEDRALSVANYLNAQGVDSRRFSIVGYGANQPIASNASAAGRAENRRVEIQIAPLT